jgi:hypothetical protein
LFRDFYYDQIFLALIELDSKTTPQGKIHSIMECKLFIEEALRTSSEITINADCFLPALIYVVLKAKPPRLHSNIEFLSQFSQPSGEQLYYLATLVCLEGKIEIYIYIYLFLGFSCSFYRTFTS